MTTLKARFDGRAFVPEQPVDFPVGQEVEIHVQEINGNGSTLDESPLAELIDIAHKFPDDPNTATDLAAQHDHYLHGTSKHRDEEQLERPLAALADWAETLPPLPDSPGDMAEQHDHYLYGTPKRKRP